MSDRDPVYSTLASYLAALETHGATVGDIPLLIANLREASDELAAVARRAEPPVSIRLAEQGFHRIGRLDDVGRRSLWLREECDAIELRAGREGADACVRVTTDHPLYAPLCDVFACARFAAEWEHPDGSGLNSSFESDECDVSIHRRDERGK